MSDNKFLNINGLSLFLTQLKNIFASKNIFNTSNPGLVPPTNSSDSTLFLSGNCTWQNESVSISDDSTYVPLDGGDA